MLLITVEMGAQAVYLRIGYGKIPKLWAAKSTARLRLGSVN
jgi:hypothetical protein